MSWKVLFTKQAQKKLKIISENPIQTPPPFEKLVGDLFGAYSRRMNIQDRLIYQIDEKKKYIKILRM